MAEIAHRLLEIMENLGYWGIMLGLAIEVIPSEIVLSFGGYLVSQGKISFGGAVLYGTAGIIIAQTLLYWIGRYGGRPFVERFGKYLLLKKHHIDVAEGWFNRYGAGIVFTARFVPVLRQAISIPAGMAKMSLAKFTFYTLLATIPWCVIFIYLGKTLGENWRQIGEAAKPYTQEFIIGALVLIALYFLFKWWRAKKNDPVKKAGAAGEKAVAHQLRFIGSDYQVLHGKTIRVRNNHQEFDHIVVGPNGIFHIETKYWSGSITFTEHGVERDGRRESQDPTAQLYRHEYILKELLKEHRMQADVVGVLCFAHPGAHVEGNSPAFATAKVDRLLHVIKTHKPKRPLSSEELKRAVGHIAAHVVEKK